MDTMTTTTCPFRISRTDEDALNHNDAFRAVREHLRRQELGMEGPSFCPFHRHSCSGDEQKTFRLHRDIIHTILLPLFLLHTRASQVASSALPCSQKPMEMERVFRGDARSAYSWLHCILTEERDWYVTERCPACIVLHVLHSEPTIRFVAVACLLAEDHAEDSEMRTAKRGLPYFDFWLEALEVAVCEDPFWGDDIWPDIEYRAGGLTDGVKQLALQCLELQSAIERNRFVGGGSHCPVNSSCPSVDPLAVKPTFTRKQLRSAREEQREQRRISKAVADKLNIRGAHSRKRSSCAS